MFELLVELTRSQVAMQLNIESSPVVFQTADEVFAMDWTIFLGQPFPYNKDMFAFSPQLAIL